MASSDSSPRLKSPPADSSAAKAVKFTSVMQDRQSRNKDPKTGAPLNTRDVNSENVNPSKRTPRRVSASDDAYESVERRRWAATVLDSPELLMMHAVSRGDSTPGTMQHFTKILCGFDNESRDEILMWQLRQRRRMGKKDREVAGEKESKDSTPPVTPYTGPFEM